jgi:nicotinic acid mononucleotide adenylyltransferase
VFISLGADVVQSMLNEQVWTEEEVNRIMSDYGVTCITRLIASKSDPSNISMNSIIEMLPIKWKENIDVVEDWVFNDISATNIRKQLENGLSVKYIVPDAVIDIIYQYGLYDSNRIRRLAQWPHND